MRDTASLPQAIATHEARHHRDLQRARRALLLAMLASADGTATNDAIHAAIKDLPDDARFLGAVPKPLQALRIIAGRGYVKSKRPEAHSRPLILWGLVSSEAAERWLRDHPEPPPAPAAQSELFPAAQPSRLRYD